MTRLATMTYALLLACLLALVAAPAAHAQLGLDPVGTVDDVVGGGSGDDGGSTDGGSGGGLIDTVDSVLNDDGDNTSSGDDGGDGSTDDTNLIDDTVKTVDDTLNNTTEPVKDTADSGTGTLDDATGGSTGGYYDGITGTVGKTTDGTGGVIDKVTSNDKPRDGKGSKTTTTSSRDQNVFDKRFQAALAADQKRRAAEARQLRATPVAVVEQPEENVVQQIGRVAAEAAEQMAFPVILLLMVGAFVVGQNRVDRRDPKLALAPVDLDADLLSFT